jgi:Hg(II)-responsive transcriptional regulator
MVEQQRNLTIGALASAAGVTVEAVRFYQRKGLLPEPGKPYGGIRRYGPADLARLRFIKSAQRIGFTLVEIAQLLLLDDGTHCAEAREIAEQKLGEVRHRMTDLQRMESALAELVHRCATSRGRLRCPLIDSLREPC